MKNDHQKDAGEIGGDLLIRVQNPTILGPSYLISFSGLLCVPEP
jgi:hypothetical protein